MKDLVKANRDSTIDLEPGFSTEVLTFFNKPLRKHLVNTEIINYSVFNNTFFPWKYL